MRKIKVSQEFSKNSSINVNDAIFMNDISEENIERKILRKAKLNKFRSVQNSNERLPNLDITELNGAQTTVPAKKAARYFFSRDIMEEFDLKAEDLPNYLR